MNQLPKNFRTKRSLGLAAVLGPGLIVMLADTDAGSIITAAQSGAQWGYRLLLLQIILIPILYIVQELTIRLGLHTGKGLAALIKSHYGKAWAWVSIGALLIACLGALVTELTGMASAGALLGLPAPFSVGLAVLAITSMIWTSSYRAVERVAIGLGAFELVFIAIAFLAQPEASAMLEGLGQMPLTDHEYLYLATANIGAVIMPWMIFYQQSAVIEKGLKSEHLRLARLETGIGAFVTQIIMASILIAVAATIGRTNPSAPLTTVHQISDCLTPFLGATVGRIVFAVGLSGSALVATIVVALTAAWSVGETLGARHSLADNPRQAPWFYGVFTLALILSGLLVTSGTNLVRLSVGVQVVNALLLPIVLGFLFLLAHKALPHTHRLKGVYAWTTGAIMIITSGFGLFTEIKTFFG